jgi:hypothetical protein
LVSNRWAFSDLRLYLQLTLNLLQGFVLLNMLRL